MGKSVRYMLLLLFKLILINNRMLNSLWLILFKVGMSPHIGNILLGGFLLN